MPGLLESELDAYSRLTVSLILARLPEWEPLAVLSPSDYGSGHVVEFNVPCPSSAVERGLWVSTMDEQLTVGFHTHHDHFRNYGDESDDEHVARALQHVADIVEGRAGVVSWYADGQLTISYSVWLPCPQFESRGWITYHNPVGVLRTVRNRILRQRRPVTLRSWSGELDRDELRR